MLDLRRREDWSTRRKSLCPRRRDLNPGHIAGRRVLSLLRIPYCRSIHIVNQRVYGAPENMDTMLSSARFALLDDFAISTLFCRIYLSSHFSSDGE